MHLTRAFNSHLNPNIMNSGSEQQGGEENPYNHGPTFTPQRSKELHDLRVEAGWKARTKRRSPGFHSDHHLEEDRPIFFPLFFLLFNQF